jgi:uncharacterized membrane protein
MVTLLALLAATAFALGTVLQQRGTLQSDPSTEGVQFLAGLFRRPVWLLGGVVTAAGWVLQALALHWGSLLAVQALVTMSLVIALPFGAWLTDQRITRSVWLGASALVAGIVLFLSVGAPESGTAAPTALAWLITGLVTFGLIGLLARTGRTQGPGPRAVAFGAAAGLGYGFQAAVTKLLTDEVGNGVLAVLTGWELWALLAAALLGLALGQSALRTGALAAAMAAINAVTLLSSVALGLTVFHESFGRGGSRLAVGVLGLGVALVGVVLLARAPVPGPRPAPAAVRPPPG